MSHLFADVRYSARRLRKRPGFTILVVARGGALFIIALLACWLPAHRAGKLNPTVALRYE